MARERSYRHDVRCRHCSSNWMPKEGHTRGRQVHKCGDCKRKYTADAARPRFPEHAKRQAVQMCIEGASISAAAVEERDGSGWIDFEVGGRDEATFLRLLERLPDAERYETDAYGVYGTLPVNKHMVGKCGAVNWNEGLHSMLRGKLNRLVRRTKGYTKSVDMLVNLLALVFCYKLKLNTT